MNDSIYKIINENYEEKILISREEDIKPHEKIPQYRELMDNYHKVVDDSRNTATEISEQNSFIKQKLSEIMLLVNRSEEGLERLDSIKGCQHQKSINKAVKSHQTKHKSHNEAA